jgi:hypothetical protein
MTALSRRTAVGTAARIAGAAVVALTLLAQASTGTALAHERRVVGPFTFVVGFLTEPAIQGEPNGIDLRITRTEGGAPVEDAEKTLKAQIAFGGGQPKEFPLRARFGTPGGYTADLIPTKAGSYIFTFTGTLEGTAVNQRFESGPGRFNDVSAADSLQFPEVAPAASLATQLNEAQDRASAAEARARQAQSIGTGGLVLGLLGTCLGAAGFVASRRRPAADAPATRATTLPATGT